MENVPPKTLKVQDTPNYSIDEMQLLSMKNQSVFLEASSSNAANTQHRYYESQNHGATNAIDSRTSRISPQSIRYNDNDDVDEIISYNNSSISNNNVSSVIPMQSVVGNNGYIYEELGLSENDSGSKMQISEKDQADVRSTSSYRRPREAKNMQLSHYSNREPISSDDDKCSRSDSRIDSTSCQQQQQQHQQLPPFERMDRLHPALHYNELQPAEPFTKSEVKIRRHTHSPNCEIDEAPAASVRKLKQQLWDKDERLQVTVQHSPRRQQHFGTEQQAVASEGQTANPSVSPYRSGTSKTSDSVIFKSKFYHAALAAKKRDLSSQGGNREPSDNQGEKLSLATLPRREENDNCSNRNQDLYNDSQMIQNGIMQHSTEDACRKNVEQPKQENDIKARPRSLDLDAPSSVANSMEGLVARLSAVNRDDPTAALALIDSILRGEGQYITGEEILSKQNRKGRECDNDDNTSVSSITNPTYKNGKPPSEQINDDITEVVFSTAGCRRQRPSMLKTYESTPGHVVSATQEQSEKTHRGRRSSRSRVPRGIPPATINILNNDEKKYGFPKQHMSQTPKGNKKKNSTLDEDMLAWIPQTQPCFIDNERLQNENNKRFEEIGEDCVGILPEDVISQTQKIKKCLSNESTPARIQAAKKWCKSHKYVGYV